MITFGVSSSISCRVCPFFGRDLCDQLLLTACHPSHQLFYIQNKGREHSKPDQDGG